MRFPIKIASLMCAAVSSLSLACMAQDPPAPVSPEAKTYQIRLNVQPGTKQFLGVAVNGDIVSTVGENSMPFTMSMSTYNNTEYLAKDDAGIYTVKTNVIIGKMLMNGQATPLPAESIKFGITMKMNEYGQPIEIISMDKMNIPNMPSTVDLNSLMKQAGMTYFPKDPIKIGDSWNNDFSLPQSTGPVMKLTNTLEKVDEKDGKQIASIRSKGKLDMSKILESATKANAMMANMKASGEGIIDMVSLVDLSTGQTVGGGGDINMTMNMSMPAQQAGQAPMNITVETNMKATISNMTEAQFLEAMKPAPKAAVRAKPAAAVKPVVKKKPTVKKSK